MSEVRPFRSVLYIPGSHERALQKARNLPADAIIFDLEDAVAADAKTQARTLLATELAAGGYAPKAQLIRVNGEDTPWGADDLAAMIALKPEALLLPKVESVAQIADVAARLDATPGCEQTQIWAMMETPLGILNAATIATAPRLAGFVIGTNDLAKEVGTRFRADRLPLMLALQSCLLAARAAGILCLDGVYNAFKDTEGLAIECEQGRDLGMDGKTLIHPSQIATANAVFAPSEDEIALARRQIDAFQDAMTQGKGVAVVDGKIVENLHVETAKVTLARAEAIAKLGREAA